MRVLTETKRMLKWKNYKSKKNSEKKDKVMLEGKQGKKRKKEQSKLRSIIMKVKN